MENVPPRKWVTWARERRDVFDPLHRKSVDLWSDLASITLWNYPD
jgi:hypothetical protein